MISNQVRVQDGHNAAEPSLGWPLSPEVLARLSTPGESFTVRIVETAALTTEQMRTHVQEADSRLRQRAAAEFAQRARTIPGVTEVWASSDPETLTVVITESHDLDRELELAAVFRGVLGTYHLPHSADLGVYAETDGVPPFARSGLQLFP